MLDMRFAMCDVRFAMCDLRFEICDTCYLIVSLYPGSTNDKQQQPNVQDPGSIAMIPKSKL